MPNSKYLEITDDQSGHMRRIDNLFYFDKFYDHLKKKYDLILLHHCWWWRRKTDNDTSKSEKSIVLQCSQG
jgi:hypothetical protein